MKNQNQKKVLLAVDGSEDALCAVRYVSNLAPFHKMKIVLFNVFSSIPESYRDLAKDPLFCSIRQGSQSLGDAKKKSDSGIHG